MWYIWSSLSSSLRQFVIWLHKLIFNIQNIILKLDCLPHWVQCQDFGSALQHWTCMHLPWTCRAAVAIIAASCEPSLNPACWMRYHLEITREKMGLYVSFLQGLGCLPEVKELSNSLQTWPSFHVLPTEFLFNLGTWYCIYSCPFSNHQEDRGVQYNTTHSQNHGESESKHWMTGVRFACRFAIVPEIAPCVPPLAQWTAWLHLQRF